MTRTTPHDDWQWFLRRAAEVAEDPALEGLRAERHELAARLQDLLAAARNGDALGPALRWVVDMPAGWRWSPPFPVWLDAWASADEESLRKALLVFSQDHSAEERFQRFAAAELEARNAHGLEERPVLTLLCGSLLNFALEPAELPVVRRDLLVLERVLGYDPELAASLPEQYANRLAFARLLRTRLTEAAVPVRDMIDVEACAVIGLHARNSHMPNLPNTDIIQLLGDETWTMTLGERAAFEGVVDQLKPALAVEIGAGQGGSLRRLSAHCGEVHEVDILDRPAYVDQLENVHWHKGDSRVLLPPLLAGFAEAGRNVDFVLVDGDHSTEGVRRDMANLLDSPAVGRTVILAHDTMNDQVRAGLQQIDYESTGKVAYVDLDFVPGIMFREPGLRYQLWGGLGLIVVDVDAPGGTVRQDTYYETYPLVMGIRQQVIEQEASGKVPRM